MNERSFQGDERRLNGMKDPGFLEHLTYPDCRLVELAKSDWVSRVLVGLVSHAAVG